MCSVNFLLAFTAILFTVSGQSIHSQQGYFALLENARNLPNIYNIIDKNSNTVINIAEKLSDITNIQNFVNAENLLNNQFEDSSFEENITTSKPQNVSTVSTLPTTTANMEQSSVIPISTTEPPKPSLPVSQTCLDHVKEVIQGLSQKERWAIQMIDAAGKPPADILGGGFIWPGGFEECLSVKGSITTYNVEGKYCMVSLPLTNIPRTAAAQKPSLSVGICIPDTCSDLDAYNLINSVLRKASNNSMTAFVNCKHPNTSFDTRATIVLVIISLFIVVMVTGTAYDIIVIQLPQWRNHSNDLQFGSNHVVEAAEKSPLITKNKHIQSNQTTTPGIFGKLLLAFSIYTNGSKILATTQGSGSLTAVNGIRFLSITWVILGHTYAFVMPVVDNTLTYFPNMIKRLSFNAVGNAFVSVDTFFTLSGILLTYLILKELKKNDGKLSWGMFYFHRFWRLTPPYMLVLMVYVSLFPYSGSGPAWPETGVEPHYCEQGWFYNLLYVNNFVEDPNKTCFGWAWYLANDMQFFVVSPLIILPLFYFHAAGLGVILAFLIGTWVASGVMATTWSVPISPFDPNAGNYMKLYSRPYFRMGPYLVGMYTGYLLYRTNCKFRMNKFVNLFGWFVATLTACLVLYGPYDDSNNGHVSQEISSLYNTVHRTIWGACVCWVVFSCANGYGGFVNTILSWKALVPLSRLTYCVYLVHPVILYYFAYSRKRLVHLTDIEMIYQFLGHVVLSFMAAFVVSLAFESPMMGLEKVIFKRKEHKR